MYCTCRWYEDNEPESIAIPDYENRILEQVWRLRRWSQQGKIEFYAATNSVERLPTICGDCVCLSKSATYCNIRRTGPLRATCRKPTLMIIPYGISEYRIEHLL